MVDQEHPDDALSSQGERQARAGRPEQDDWLARARELIAEAKRIAENI